MGRFIFLEVYNVCNLFCLFSFHFHLFINVLQKSCFSLEQNYIFMRESCRLIKSQNFQKKNMALSRHEFSREEFYTGYLLSRLVMHLL